MKKMFRVLTAMAMVSAMAVPAQAGTATANLDVSASVTANCTITTTPLAFGAYDPIVTHKETALTNAGSIKVTCTFGAPVSVALDDGANVEGVQRRMTNGAAFLSYDLFSDGGREIAWGGAAEVGTTGTGAEETLTVYGSVAAGQNVPTGSYTDTVVATVTF